MAEFVEMVVAGIALDPSTNAPIVILKGREENVLLPIWIGLMEANSIAAALEGVTYSRPMTHDLFKAVLDAFHTSVKKIEVVDVKDNVFYAVIYAEMGGKRYRIDSRPSDAIAMALRLDAGIFVAEKVIRESAGLKVSEELAVDMIGFESDAEKMKDLLDVMNPDDFGKFKA